MERYIAAVALALSLAGCNLESHDNGKLVVVVTPGQVSILAGSSVRLAATVTGAGPVPQAVTWTLRCRAGCGAARSGVTSAP